MPKEISEKINEFLEAETSDEDRLYDLYLTAYINKTDYTNIHQITEDLCKLECAVLHPPAGKQFLTTDNPGFLKCGPSIVSLGGFGGNFEFYYPISPTACLYLDSKKTTPLHGPEKVISHIKIEPTYVSQINRWSISVCNTKVFSLTKSML